MRFADAARRAFGRAEGHPAVEAAGWLVLEIDAGAALEFAGRATAR